LENTGGKESLKGVQKLASSINLTPFLGEEMKQQHRLKMCRKPCCFSPTSWGQLLSLSGHRTNWFVVAGILALIPHYKFLKW